MMHLFMQDNNVKIAVHKAGGPTKVSNALFISNGTVHSWVRKGRIADLDFAKKVSLLSGVGVDLLRPML